MNVNRKLMEATNTNKKTKVLVEEEQEDLALMTAMNKGLQSGIATEDEKREFESWLSQSPNNHS